MCRYLVCKLFAGAECRLYYSVVSDFHTALGQFLNYRDALEIIEPDRRLYLAVRVPIYETFFQRRFIVAALGRYQLRLMIYDVQQEVIVQWL